MKTFKKLVLFALVALMTLQFTGCKKDNSVTNNADLSSETLISKEPIELTVFYPSSKE